MLDDIQIKKKCRTIWYDVQLLILNIYLIIN